VKNGVMKSYQYLELGLLIIKLNEANKNVREGYLRKEEGKKKRDDTVGFEKLEPATAIYIHHPLSNFKIKKNDK